MPLTISPFSGSSPLARGLRAISDGRIYTRRIIPARAGFTISRSGSNLILQDHPRSRGVYWRMSARIPLKSGSSPLARGLRVMLTTGTATVRIIPARAGFTLSARRRRIMAGDHPRSRGVYPAIKRAGRGIAGSSPLARGLRRSVASIVREARIIPARAGFTAILWTEWPSRTDHPRSRGVYRRVS